MHNWRSKVAAAVAVPVLAITAAACGEAGGGGEGDIKGKVRADGSSTVAPLTSAASELFKQEQPGVDVTVGTAGTGGGFEKFCAGETEISDASRPIKDEEKEACEKEGIDAIEVQVANDALTVMVHKDNPVNCLSVEQLKQIWEPNSKLTKWSEIDGLDANFDEKLDLYGPGTDSGTFDYFTDEINGEEGEQRTNYNDIGENDNTGITGVSGSKGGMFYAGFSYFEANKDKVKALEIDGGDGCVAPSAAAVQDGTYTPLGRPLFIYVSSKALEQEHVKAFVDFYVEKHAEIATAAEYVPMNDEQAAKSAEDLK